MHSFEIPLEFTAPPSAARFRPADTPRAPSSSIPMSPPRSLSASTPQPRPSTSRTSRRRGRRGWRRWLDHPTATPALPLLRHADQNEQLARCPAHQRGTGTADPRPRSYPSPPRTAPTPAGTPHRSLGRGRLPRCCVGLGRRRSRCRGRIRPIRPAFLPAKGSGSASRLSACVTVALESPRVAERSQS